MIDMDSYNIDSSYNNESTNYLNLLLKFYILIINVALLIIILKNFGFIKPKDNIIYVSKFRITVKNENFMLV